MSLDCNITKKNLGLSKCNKLPSLIKSIITTPATFKLTPSQLLTEAATKTALQNALLSGIAQRIYLWPNFVGFENISQEAVYEDNALAYIPVRDGNYRFKFHIKESLCFHKAMYTHRANGGRAFLFDVENQLIGTQDDDGNFMGLSIQNLNTEKLMFSDGSVSTKSPILLALSDNKELDQDGAILDAAFVNTLTRLTDVTLEVVSASATTIVVKVFVTCDETPVNGLTDEDFVVLDAAGDPQTISGATEDDGTYTLTGSSIDSGTIDLVAAADLSVPGYEAQETTLTVGS